MRGLLLIVVAGCWTEARPAAQPAPVQTTSVAASVAPRDTPTRVAPHHHDMQRTALPRHTVWQGSYYCSQGLTAAHFVLDLEADRVHADAIFEFSQHPDNRNPVPEGAAHLRGTLVENGDGSYKLDVDPFEWINQPPGYFMVGVEATLDAHFTEIHGRMKADTCGRFDVTRASN